MFIHWPVSHFSSRVQASCQGAWFGFFAVDMKLGCHDSVMFDANLLLYMFCWQRCSFDFNIYNSWILLSFNSSFKPSVYIIWKYSFYFKYNVIIFIVNFQFNLAAMMIMMWWPWSHFIIMEMHCAEKLGPNIVPWLRSQMSEGQHQRVSILA